MLQIMSDYALRYPSYSQPSFLLVLRKNSTVQHYTQCLLYCNVNECST